MPTESSYTPEALEEYSKEFRRANPFNRCPVNPSHRWSVTSDGEREVCMDCKVERSTYVFCPQCGEKTRDLHYVSPHMWWAGCFACFCKVADRVEESVRMASAVTKLQREVAVIFEEVENTKEEGDPSE